MLYAYAQRKQNFIGLVSARLYLFSEILFLTLWFVQIPKDAINDENFEWDEKML